jgi:DNA polymerase-3 subunit chi
MAEVLFYHLERSTLEKALPDLLQRSLDRGWRAVVKFGTDERLNALNAHLWAFEAASFLPHGAAGDGNPEDHPVWLTTADDNPNGAAVRFVVDGADAADFSQYVRTVFIFDASDAEGVSRARVAFKASREAGHEAIYRRQDENGRWVGGD